MASTTVPEEETPKPTLFDATKDDAEYNLAAAEDGQKLVENNADVQENLVEEDTPWSTRMLEVFTTFWPLGFVAFGGPQAHIAILRDHLVVQRDWMDEDAFTGE